MAAPVKAAPVKYVDGIAQRPRLSGLGEPPADRTFRYLPSRRSRHIRKLRSVSRSGDPARSIGQPLARGPMTRQNLFRDPRNARSPVPRPKTAPCACGGRPRAHRGRSSRTDSSKTAKRRHVAAMPTTAHVDRCSFFNEFASGTTICSGGVMCARESAIGSLTF